MNTKKILGIFICMLVLTMIPVTAGATTQPEPETTDIGWTTIQGIIGRPKEVNGGALIEFKCIFVHYVAQGLGQRITGFRYNLRTMVIPNTFRGVLMPGMIMGFCIGQLEV